jgi:hypothetical protein
MVPCSAPVAHTWDLKIGKCYIHTQLVTGVIGRQNHNVANTTGVTNMVSGFRRVYTARMKLSPANNS